MNHQMTLFLKDRQDNDACNRSPMRYNLRSAVHSVPPVSTMYAF